jgi:hypothetical protein
VLAPVMLTPSSDTNGAGQHQLQQMIGRMLAQVRDYTGHLGGTL